MDVTNAPKAKKSILKKWWFWVGIVIVLIIIAASSGGKKDGSNDPSSSSNTTATTKPTATTATTYSIGDTIKTNKFEITITSVEERTQVGSTYINKTVSEGGTYVAIKWQMKNISTEPIGMFSQPSIGLEKSGVKYDADITASSYYATEQSVDAKILSDLNPGITVKDADVFEISKEQYAGGTGWRILVKADKDYYVNIQ